jgi:CheY-like chemotaxis protein/HPt (histidine-containing phosphotransfer) domain-containing protein
MAELMGGAIEVSSELNQGTVFTVKFVAIPGQEGSEEAFIDNLVATSALQGRRALLVDDNVSALRILGQRLAVWGVQTVHAQSKQEALELLAKDHHFDFAIIDFSLKQEDGLSLVKIMRQTAGLEKLKVMMLSSQIDCRELDHRKLCQTHLLKPVKESVLFDALSILLNDFIKDTPAETASTQNSNQASASKNYAAALPVRMLIVDDNATNRKVAAMMLERYGYHANFAVDGREAVDQIMAFDAAKNSYDVVWMDIHMPNLDGLESTKIVRKAAIKQPHIVAMTAAAMQGDREICLQAGMDDYVSKPLNSGELERAIEAFLEKRGVDLSALSNSQKTSAETSASENVPQVQSDRSLYFNPDQFMAFCSGNPAYRSTFLGLIRNMLQKGPTQYADGYTAWQEGRTDDSARIFHTMRGSLGTLGAVSFIAESRKLEAAIREGDQAQTAVLFEEIKVLLDTTFAEAQAWLDAQV